jgi:hypothetical protein
LMVQFLFEKIKILTWLVVTAHGILNLLIPLQKRIVLQKG